MHSSTFFRHCALDLQLEEPKLQWEATTRYGSLFRTSLVGGKIVVFTDPDVNRFTFQQEGKLVQSWYMDSFDDIVVKENGRNKAMKVIKSMLEERRASPKRQKKGFLDMVVEEMKKAETIRSEQTALDLLFALPFAAFESASSAVILALQYLRNNPLAMA
ncbi:hypothetical protein CRYUN_Cryun13aG0073800 [Craigia yunnanensis]